MQLKTVVGLFINLVAITVCIPVSAVLAAGQQVVTVEPKDNGVIVHNDSETIHLNVCGPNVIHVVAGREGGTAGTSRTPWMISECKPSPFKLERAEKEVTLKTTQMEVSISLENAHLSYRTVAGESLINEDEEHPRDYSPVIVNGEHLYEVTDRFHPDEAQGLYGLGQHQNGVFNYRGSVVELAQDNTSVAVPLMVSTNGYGIMWNTASHTEFDNRFQRFFRLTSKATDGIDYYFIYGPEVDQIIHEYRDLTGHAPLFGKWAYGFVQSKDKYTSAQQLLNIGEEYRTQHVPLDLIVQDWFWWKHQGDPQYDTDYLKPHPDVPDALTMLHAEHLHAIISIWPIFTTDSNTYHAMKAAGGLIPGLNIYDPTNPLAREIYWKLLASQIRGQGWDGFWLDASEPEATLDDKQLAIGNGARYTNIFPLMHTGNIYEHWRQTDTGKRAFILTRSAFLGQQRNAAVTWSGDVYGTFMNLSRQVPAGLNFAVSGIPYWTTDIAGYTSPHDMKDPTYRELYARWYEFGVFCPVFRTHGHRPENEVFSYGSVTPILIDYDKLRYRLMPYIYSLAWRVTNDDYTIQRPLIMDWRTVEKVRDIGDQFMFGPSILVSPVTAEGASSRSMYLPPSAGWYNFWTGERVAGNQRIEADAPLKQIPLYVRAGSILPLGPEIQYATEKPDGPVTLRIYRGADATFDLYEDEGDNYSYEKGAHAIIPIRWDEATKRLSFKERVGTYPGMTREMEFRIVWVSNGHGTGGGEDAEINEVVHYDGKALAVVGPST